MSILEILIPTVLFMALVVLRAEGKFYIKIYFFIHYQFSLYAGGEDFNPIYKNATTYKRDAFPSYFCKALTESVTNGS